MITKAYVKVGNRVKYIYPCHSLTDKCGTITRTTIGAFFVYFEVEWDHLTSTNRLSYHNEAYYSYFSKEQSPAPKKHYRRATEKDFKHSATVRCRSKRKKGYWKGDTGRIIIDHDEKHDIKNFIVSWDDHAKRKAGRFRETWTDFTKNFEVVAHKKSKKQVKIRRAPIDTTLPILQAGHLQDRFIRRAK